MRSIITDIFSWINQNQLISGILIGWLFSRVWEEFRKPNLTLEVGDEAYWPQTSNAEIKFLHIRVKNTKRNILTALFFSNPTANNARAWVSFHDYISGKEVAKMNGRWVSKREPVDYITGKIDLPEALLPPRETIPAGEETNISIALKDKNKPSFFGFNNESYFHNWRNPELELSEKRYVIKVKISAEGKEWVKEYLLLNPGSSIKNFKLVHR